MSDEKKLIEGGGIRAQCSQAAKVKCSGCGNTSDSLEVWQKNGNICRVCDTGSPEYICVRCEEQIQISGKASEHPCQSLQVYRRTGRVVFYDEMAASLKKVQEQAKRQREEAEALSRKLEADKKKARIEAERHAAEELSRERARKAEAERIAAEKLRIEHEKSVEKLKREEVTNSLLEKFGFFLGQMIVWGALAGGVYFLYSFFFAGHSTKAPSNAIHKIEKAAHNCSGFSSCSKSMMAVVDPYRSDLMLVAGNNLQQSHKPVPDASRNRNLAKQNRSMARAYMNRRNYKEAVTYFEKAVHADQGDEPLLLELADAHIKNDEVKKAQKNLEKALTMSPFDEKAWWIYARTLTLKDSSDQAIRAYLVSWRLSKNRDSTRKGFLFMAKNSKSEAERKIYETAYSKTVRP